LDVDIDTVGVEVNSVGVDVDSVGVEVDWVGVDIDGSIVIDRSIDIDGSKCDQYRIHL